MIYVTFRGSLTVTVGWLCLFLVLLLQELIVTMFANCFLLFLSLCLSVLVFFNLIFILYWSRVDLQWLC